MKSVVTVLENIAGISHTYLPIKAAMSLFMEACYAFGVTGILPGSYRITQ